MVRGATPAAAEATTRARGRRPSALAFWSLINKTAAAPSLMPDEFPVRVGSTPAEGGAPRGAVAKSPVGAGLGKRIGRGGHASPPAGKEDLALASLDGARGRIHRRQPRGAQPVKGDRCHRHRQAG